MQAQNGSGQPLWAPKKMTPKNDQEGNSFLCFMNF